jgi:hypothetical protein
MVQIIGTLSVAFFVIARKGGNGNRGRSSQRKKEW